MIPLVRRLFRALLWDELAVRRWLRGGALAFAAGGIAFADQLASIVGAPGAVRGIKIAAVICGFVGGAITAGERNPPTLTTLEPPR